MKFFWITALMFAGGCTFLFGCQKPDEVVNCDSGIISLPVDSITGPATVAVGAKADFYVHFAITNGCGTFLRMEESQAGNTISLRVKGRYTGCACTQVYTYIHKPYPYSATQPSTYTIRIVQRNGASKMYTFTVQ